MGDRRSLYKLDEFDVTHCFDYYTWQPNFLEAKNGGRQWKNFKNLLLKQIAKLWEIKQYFFYYVTLIFEKYSLSLL